MTDLYGKIRADVGFHKEVTERAGFELPPIVLNVPNFDLHSEKEVLA